MIDARPLTLPLLFMLVAGAPAVAQTPVQVAKSQAGDVLDVQASRLLDRPANLDVRDMPLEHALLELVQRSAVPIAFSAARLPKGARVSCACIRVSTAAALDRLFAGTRMAYEEMAGQVVVYPPPDGAGETWLRPRFRASFAGPGLPSSVRTARSWTPERQGAISGTVIADATGEPLAGVVVSVLDTELGGLTDANGDYAIENVPAGSVTLTAQRLGYQSATEEVTVVAGRTVRLDFVLQHEAILLDGIVAVGYGTQARRDVTGAVASVQAEQLRRVPTSNLVHAMQGRMAGVDITRSNFAPGAGVTIRIRGVRSLTASNNPLFVVDGVPISGGIQDFVPANIESIEVLKDASATAIYGSRGANGVVLITTQAGLPGRARITYNTYAGIQRPLNLVRMMNGPEFAAYKREANWAVPGRENWTDEDIFYPEELEAIRTGQWTDWQRQLVQTGFQQQHQVGINGATDNTRFSLSWNYFDHEGITIEQGSHRHNASFSFDHTVGRMRVGLSASTSRMITSNGPGNGVWGEALANSPLGVPYDENGLLLPKATSDPLRINPLIAVHEHVSENVRNRVFGSLFGELQISDGVTWRTNFGPDLSKNTNGSFQSVNRRNGAPASASKSESETFAYTLTNILRFDRYLGSHRVDATLVHEVQQQQSQSSSLAAEDFPYDHQLWHNLNTAEVRTTFDSDLSEWALESYMGRLNYSLRDRYLLTATGRFDGSSRLAEGKKWSFFPSLGLGWQIGDESFMQDLGWFSDLKLRGSYGVTGNTSINPYQTQGTLTLTRYSFNFGALPSFGWRPGSIPNPDLVWEKTHQYNFGIDWGILSNRITGNIDLYRQDTKDLLMTRGLPPASGFTSVLMNIGATRNTGVEVALSTVNLENWNGLRWTMDMNVTANRNKIVQLSEGGDQVGNGWFIGHPISVHYDYEFAGIWQLHEAEEAARFNQQPGQIKVVDQDGGGRITADDDRVILGSSYPDWIGSWSNRFAWRNLDLSVMATARLGYMFYDSFGTSNSLLSGRYGNLLVDYWTPDNPSNRVPRPDESRGTGAGGPLWGSSRGYTKGDHVRIRNVTIGYRIPQNLITRVGGSAARVYATMQDPYVFTSYHGYDPEGGTSSGTPSYWTLLIGANLTF